MTLQDEKVRITHHPLWARIIFYPIISLWLGWCFLLGCKIIIIDGNKVLFILDKEER